MENLIRRLLIEKGFTSVGFLRRDDADFGDWMEPWLSRGYHATMDWMEDHQAIRRNPCDIEPYGRSIITAVIPYYTEAPREWGNHRYISCYAWGADYHQVIRKKMKSVVSELERQIDGFKGRVCVDTAPLPEKVIAARSGLGWIGKNSLLITPEHGSFVFIGEIICNLDLTSSTSLEKDCGDCQRCVDNCPNEAIQPSKMIDSRRCASFLTIEKRGDFTGNEGAWIGDHLFGCDICQRVCPWNQDLEPVAESDFCCFERWRDISMETLSMIDETDFNQLKISSPIKRLKLEGIRRNASTIQSNLKKRHN